MTRPKRRLPEHSDPSVKPPAEQLARRVYEASGGRGTPKRWRFRDTPLELALHAGKVTPRQVAAGDAWEALIRRIGLTQGPRSCLDDTVRGTTEQATQSLIDATAAHRRLVQKLGMSRSATLHSVCVYHQPIGRLSVGSLRFVHLIEALNIVADFYGLAEDGT